jgi:hypothetical protein
MENGFEISFRNSIILYLSVNALAHGIVTGKIDLQIISLT